MSGRPRPDRDPGACWVRHIKRGDPGDQGAVTVLAATFVAQPPRGVNGRQGWQSAQPEVRLSDDGSFSIRFPNAAGEDGVLHRERFALLTDPTYRVGEEWLEVWREPDDLLIVGTPVRPRLSRSELVIEGLDAPALMRAALSSESDVWVGAAPLDVMRFYSGVPVLRVAQGFAGYNGANLPAGWATTGGAAVGADGILLDPGETASFDTTALGITATDWVFESRWRHLANTAADGRLRDIIGGVQDGPRHAAGGVLGGSRMVPNPPSRVLDYALPGTVVHRIIARGEWVYVYTNGELTSHGRRTELLPPGVLTMDTVNATAVLQSVRVTTLDPLLMRDAPADLRLPGVPPAGGLRARYYLENDARAAAGVTTANFRHFALSPFLEPYAERLEAPGFAGANPPAWQPAGPPSGEAFSARWTGAIYLDLEASDRVLSIDAGSDTLGRVRVWVGGELVIDYSALEPGPPGRVFSNALRAFLGNLKGWFPIHAEYSHLTGSGGFGLYDQPGAAFDVLTRVLVPAGRLSPLGTVDREVRNEFHREVFGAVAADFGYQWRVEPRSLESGRFPGQIVAAARVGRATGLIIDSLEASDIGVEGDAADAIDGLVVDASGLATIQEDAQLSYEAFTAVGLGHLVYSAGYESLAEISEEPLLRTRAESLLALRSSPAETVGVRPKGHRGFVDAFPIPAVTELARMLWLPGDGVRLDLEELGVHDATPRQLTMIQWPLTPDGAGPPVVGFRQRGRGARAAFERLRNAAYAPRRSYQGQMAIVLGTLGATPALTNVADAFSRINLPPDRPVLAIDVVVQSATGGTRTLYVNGVATTTVLSRAGRHSLLAFYTPEPTGNSARMYVELRDVAASGGNWSYQLEAVVRI